VSARRCSSCGLNWPDDHKKYKTCPECAGKTDSLNNSAPMDSTELNHRLFEVFFKAWDEKRVEAEKQAEDLIDSLDLAVTDGA